MKTNIFKNAVALIATFFLFAVGSAMALNNLTSDYCGDETAVLNGWTQISDTLVLDGCLTPDGDTLKIYMEICFKCPENPENWYMAMNLWSFKFSEEGILNNSFGCDWHEQVQEYITNIDWIMQLCPGVATIPPCDNSTAIVTIKEPRCGKLIRTADGLVATVPCEYPNTDINCFCTSVYEYCFDNGVVQKTLIAHGPTSEDGATCPADDDPVYGTCSTLSIEEVTLPGPNEGDESECYYNCQ